MKKMTCFKKVTDSILDLFYPRRCLICGKFIRSFQRLCLCRKCMEKKNLPRFVRDDEYMFEEAAVVLKYEDVVRETMMNFKFNSQIYYGYTFAKIIFDSLGKDYFPDDRILCCVPLTASRDRKYNQTAVILEELAQLLNMTPTCDLLWKSRDISPISTLGRDERRLMVAGTIGVNPHYDITGRKVIVIDDIFTTGSTANECAKALKINGADSVKIVCACGPKYE